MGPCNGEMCQQATLDFGGKRLAVTNDGLHCIAGAYQRHGVGCYEVASGKEVWRRKDLKKAQWIGVSFDDREVHCALEGRPCFVLDVKTGKEIRRHPGTRRLWESAYGPWVLADGARPELRTAEGKRIALFKRETFCILSAAFSPRRLCISESNGSTRSLDVGTGKEVWRYEPPKGSHVLCVSYAPKTLEFSAVEWPYEKGGPYTLLSFQQDSDDPKVVHVFDSSREVAFCNNGDDLLTSNGELIDTRTGKTVQRFSLIKNSGSAAELSHA